MKKLLSIISIVLAGVGISHAQVGIGTDDPKGALDLNSDKWGLVLPVVPSADTVHVTTSAGDVFYPSVTTPSSNFKTITTRETDDEGDVITTNLVVPEKEAPAGTIVFDAGKDGIRVKRSSGAANAPNGDWCDDRIVDSTTVVKDIRNQLYGGEVFKMVDVAAGYRFSIGIQSDDSLVYAAGSNTYYKTGMGAGRNGGYTRTWTLILGNAGKAVQVSAGYRHAAALMKNGDVYTWGANAYGKTALGTTSGYAMAPTKVNLAFLDAGDRVIQVEAGYYNTLFLTAKGKVYIAGRGTYGMLGNGISNNDTYYTSPRDITSLFALNTGETITQVSLAARLAAAVTSQGRVFTWGANANGSTGRGVTSNYSQPGVISIPSTDPISMVSMGIGSGLALTRDGLHLYHWGRNTSLGGSASGQSTSVTTPVRIDALTNTVLQNEGEKIIFITSPKHRNNAYSGDSHIVITNYSVYASGTNTEDATNPGKLGVVNDDTGAALNPITAFKEIQNHSIYEGTQFTKASIGNTHAFIMTGPITGDTEAKEHAYQYYTTYGAGRNNYYQLGGGATAGWRIFTSTKR